MSFLDPIKECYQFLNYPTRNIQAAPVEKPIPYILSLFLFAFLTNIFLISVVSTFVDFENMENGIVDIQDKFGPMVLFLLAVILAPVVEEIIFRFPLRNKIAFTFLLIGLDAIIVGVICQGLGYHNLAIYLPPITAILSIALIFGLKELKQDWNSGLDNFYPYLFFFVAGMFGFIHIYNYGASSFEWWMTPFIVIPQFVLGLFLGFVRIRIGLWACILMHALNNAIPVAFMFLDLPTQ